MIQQRLGYVTVYRVVRNDRNTIWRYAAGSNRQVDLWTHMLNGNLVTPRKRSQFRDWMRRRRAYGHHDPRKRTHHPQPSRRHAWWSGFSEGDLGFSIENLRVGSNRFLLTTKIYWTQTRAVGLLRSLLKLWKSDVATQAKTNPRSHHRIEITRFDAVVAVTNYFRRYPLRGQRRVMMARWRRFVDWRANGLVTSREKTDAVCRF